MKMLIAAQGSAKAWVLEAGGTHVRSSTAKEMEMKTAIAGRQARPSIYDVTHCSLPFIAPFIQSLVHGWP